MDYWRGAMDWPLCHPWECPVCDSNTDKTFHGLTWGMVHGVCRCNQCHAEFSMRDGQEDSQIIDTPRWLVFDKYREVLPAKWKELRKPLSEWTEDVLDLPAVPEIA